MADDSRLVVMAKAPVAGFAKTRLIPALGPEGAARLAARLLAHTLEAARGTGVGSLVLACAPDCVHAAFAAQRRLGGLTLVDQGAGDLGARMWRQFACGLDAGASRVLLIGTDAPALDAVRLRQADAALRQDGVDAVFVPAFDGGYALVGLRTAAPQLFCDMPWGTAAVMANTRARLDAAGLRAVELAAVPDIDEPADLAHLPEGWL